MKAIRCTSLAKAYGRHVVLDGFSIEFEAGRVSALVGPNGVGKTTLLRIIAGLQHADGGGVFAPRTLYYGGFDTMPVNGTVARFARTVGLEVPELAADRRGLATLSRGELHRLGLTAAFALASDALLLDEPWTALEPDAREALNLQIIEAARTGRVVICSSHDLDEVARVADDVVFIRDGQALRRRREDESLDRDRLLALYREAKS